MSLRIFLTTWNTGLQGSKAQAQDLTSWLLPVLERVNGEVDIYAIAVQELLPVHLALAGLAGPVMLLLTERIAELLSSKSNERYSMVSKVSHGGNALWVFARDSIFGSIGKPLTSTLGLWWLGMSNKGAVGVRIPIRRDKGWETLTFVCTHLEAHDHNIPTRNAQYQSILSSLVFKSSDPLSERYQIFDSSHLFFMGDLNYRLERLPSSGWPKEGQKYEEMLPLDTLRREQRVGRVFGGLREGELTFAPTYKRIVGQVDGYTKKRIPGWTDRILFASWTDPQNLYAGETDSPDTTTQIVHFGSTPEITISDHKPVHAILDLPPVDHSISSPQLAPRLPTPPSPHPPRPAATAYEMLILHKILGMVADRVVGWPWTLVVFLGLGNSTAGLGVSAFIAMIWGVWWTGLFSN